LQGNLESLEALKLHEAIKTQKKFVGYLCKDCKGAFFVKTKLLKLKPNKYGNLGAHHLAKDYENAEPEIIVKSYSVSPKDGKKIDSAIKKLGIKLHRM